ncbi:MAG: HesA/MoeB/ThiF family protein [Candidatus Heimdallarchaeota archaeon]|nr:HesA/MoeB/ThiF family protein [Candidatus Heimdallarchaeota archaeon]MDH5646262.1 HesA/MoeB/ThiF family protein [Candidatus Heimdallarchaeota archaeon]
MSGRYNRQELIPDWDQAKLTNAKVLVLGVGATGSFLATSLVLSGVGKIILVDFDTIELSNLNRQLLFTPNDIGKNKAEVAAKKLSKMNPDIEIIPYSKAMETMPKELTQDITLIASCLDSFRGRRWANSFALNKKVPLVSSGIYAFLGNVQTIIPYKTPCFECQPLISQEKLSQACTPLGEARKDQKEEKKEAPLPSVSTISSIISGLMSQEVLKLLLNIGKPIENYLFYDGLHNNFTELPLQKNTNCPICGDQYKLQNASAIVFKGEKVLDFKNRIALAFGMANPRVMLKGKFLTEESEMICEDNAKLYVIDERLAAPIVLNIVVQEEL